METSMSKKSLRKQLFLQMLFSLVFLNVYVPCSFADVIIDNGDIGTSSTGTWQVSGGTEPYGTDSLWARDGATYTWSFDSQPSGRYEALMWWSGWSSRATGIDVDINYSGGSGTVNINQSESSGQWNSLGEYDFGSSGSVMITAANGSTVSTCADAVWFRFISGNSVPTAFIDSIIPNPAEPGQVIEFTGHGEDSDGSITAYSWESSIDGNLGNTSFFSTDTLSEGAHTISFRVQDDGSFWSEAATETLVVGTLPVEIIIDNRDAETSSTGTWQVSGGPDPYDIDSVWSRDGSIFTWFFTPPQTGNYTASFWWTQWSSRSTAVPVEIDYEGGVDTVFVNQQQNGGQWNDLGEYLFESGQSYSITITAQPGPSSTCADAVKFNFLSSNAAPTAVIDLISPNSVDVNELVYFEGHGEDSDGTIAAYSWVSSIDGNLSDANSFSKVLSEGEHTITFRVQDNEGSWSAQATDTLVVGNIIPVASIDSISPNPCPVGDTATFIGHGEDLDGSIVAYSWESSIDGNLSDANSFSTDTLSEGSHLITFTVYDDDGAASEPVSQVLTVQGLVVEVIIDNGQNGTSYTGTWSVSGGPNPYDGDSLWSRDGSSYTWTFTPQVSGNYELFMWWTEWSSRSQAVPAEIEYAGGATSTVFVNQQQDGGQWNSLGEFSFEAGFSYDITITSPPGPSSTSADAVRLLYLSDIGDLPPEATIDSLSPNPANIGQMVTLNGSGIDNDGGIAGYEWNSSIDGLLGNTASLSASNFSEGTHTIYFKVLDEQENWSPEVSATMSVGVEHIYVCFIYGGRFPVTNLYISMLQSIGATQQGNLWTYTNQAQNKTYTIHILDEDMAGTMEALTTHGAHVIIIGHANYGTGPAMLTASEVYKEMSETIRYIDDDKILNISTPWIHVSIGGMRTGQAYPYWWPIFKDGTSGIMPYNFGDPNGDPPYNYYLTYQVPGDANHYKVETAHNAAMERFSDARSEPWYSMDGSKPDANDPNHLQYFITNPSPWTPSFESVGNWSQYQDEPEFRDDSAYFKENYIYNAAGGGSDQAKWFFTIPEAGTYTISGWWPASATNASGAPYTINHAGASTTIQMNQTVNGQQWNDIGQFYFDADDYSVVLTDAAGSGNVVADGVRISDVNNPPEVVASDFIATPRSGAAPLDVQLINQGSGDLTGRTWDLGDGFINTTRDYVDHQYTTPGSYTITLTVSGPMGSDTKTKVGYITVGVTEPEEVLQAEFSTWSREGRIPLRVSFQDMSSGDLRKGVTYTPGPGFSGTATFTYTVGDDDALTSNEATVSVLVGNSPVAEDDSAITSQGTAVVIDVLSNDVDPDGNIESNSVVVTSLPGNGTVEVNDVEGSITYTPTVIFSGTDTFGYTVEDNDSVVSNEATVTIIVGNSPVAKDDEVILSENKTIKIDVVDNDIDPDGTIDANTIVVVSFPGNGAAEANEGKVIYIPDTNYVGQDSFTYTVEDNNSVVSNEATVTITVGNTPVAKDDSAITGIGVPVTINILSNDDDSDGSIDRGAKAVTSGPTNGTVEVHDSWLWDFGDGQTSHEQYPRHTYPDVGNYTVSLTVTDAEGSTATETKENFVRAIVYEKSIDNVDYPKTHYRSKTILFTGEAEIARDDMKYHRILYDSCNSGNYFIGNFNRELMFYTVANSGGEGSVAYLRGYLLGDSDEEIWEAIQEVEPAYDYYNFNLPPEEQTASVSSQALSVATRAVTAAAVSLDPNDEEKIAQLEGLSLVDAFEALKEPDFIVNEDLLNSAISTVFGEKKAEAIELALDKIKLPMAEIIDGKEVSRRSDFRVAKKILEAFSDEAIGSLLELYESSGAVIKGNVIRVAGRMVGNPSIRNMFIKALDERQVCEENPPEGLGDPLRVCDLAYNQLVLNYKIKDILRTIGTTYSTQVRDEYINILKSKL